MLDNIQAPGAFSGNDGDGKCHREQTADGLQGTGKGETVG